MATLREKLQSVPLSEWKIKHLAISDWHDGPRIGFCALEYPACTFAYEIIAERWREDALYLLREAPEDAAERHEALLSDRSLSIEQRDQAMERLYAECTPTYLLLQTRCFETFTAVWDAVNLP
jgi:hypothetical protein